MKNVLYLDCSSGISGDMTVAALLDLGADQMVLQKTLESLPLDGWKTHISYVYKSGLRACDFDVELAEDNHDHDMEYLHGHLHDHEHHHGHAEGQGHEHHHGHAEDHDHAHHHEHHARNLQDIQRILQGGNMTPRARELALKIFGIVAAAESRVHGKALEEVHFHEVGAVDSIIDIAATAVCVDNLGIEEVIIPELTEGTGRIRCQHGLLPIPVPATAAIAEANQLPLHIVQVQGELVTPTGAAIAAALRTSGEMPEQFVIKKTGMGAGKRQYQVPGILRAMLLEVCSETETEDEIVVLESNLDDCTGEALGFVMDRLMEAGALDVYYTPVYMKKNRPAYCLSVLCKEAKRTELEAVIFCNTTTIGIRRSVCRRTKLERSERSVCTPWGMARVKCCTHGDTEYLYPEDGSVRELAEKSGKGYTEMYYEVKRYAAEAD